MTLRISAVCMVLWLVCGMDGHTQSLHGIITDDTGNPLPFATIYIPDLRRGTASNVEGEYVLALERGSYKVRFQYLGYRTQTQTVVIGDKHVELNVVLIVEPVQLSDVMISAEREDPAYTIIRKAIAKAKYHTQQLDSYTATAYIKGSGRLKGVPALFRKTIEKELEKEGIDTSTAFTTESVSEITYTRPNQYEEKTISIRTVGDDMNTDPIGFIQSSFYEPEVNGSVSPLSPRAFAYYKYEFLGEFSDQGHTINKIRVTPRSRGDNVFEGTIYIVDQHWSIHSLNLDTYIWGIKFNIQQIYQPVEENVWLPLNQIFHVTGAFFGFKFEFQYFANISDYRIVLNPDLTFVPEVIDDKIEPGQAQTADQSLARQEGSTIEKLASGEEVSRKQLRKLLKEYEQQEQKEWGQDTLQGVVEVHTQSVDTMAYRRDSVYWTRIRPLPLTEFEEKGYRVQDSLARAHAVVDSVDKDSMQFTVGDQNNVVVKSRSKFQLRDLLYGGSYKISERARFALDPLLNNIGFNTVDGYHAEWGVRFYSASNAKLNWSVGPRIRYPFARDVLDYQLLTRFGVGRFEHKWGLVLEVGRYPFQLNPDNPIHPLINNFMSLLFERNYMKIYEKDYILLGLQKDFGREIRAALSGEWAKNEQLMNHSDFLVFDNKKRTYTSNIPVNNEIDTTYFPTYRSAILNFKITTSPWLKYSIRNGAKSVVDNSSPELSIQYRVAIPGLFDSDIDYHQIEGGIRHTIRFAGGGLLNFNLTGGTFPGNKVLYFPQFRHFAGNRTPFATLDPAKSFRMLDYYTFSTQNEYLTVFTNYQFRKLLATQIFEVRLAGLKESVFLNFLETQSSDHYVELGYGLNYIFRVFRLEFVTAWQDFRYQDFAVRIGIAANLDNLFK